MTGSLRKQQKKLDKSRQKREQRKKAARLQEANFEGASLLRLASNAPFGPCWVGVSLDEEQSEEPPQLVSAIVTRRVRGQLCGVFAMVDRTCLGVKDAYRLPLLPEPALRELVVDVLEPLGELRECEAIEAQSVLFHALDHAASLGFVPHHDFAQKIIEPRPSSLLATPLAHPARPFYVSGPDDDVEPIIEQLNHAIGAGRYDFVTGPLSQSELDFDLIDDAEFMRQDAEWDSRQPCVPMIETSAKQSRERE